MATYDLRNEVNLSSKHVPPEVDEMAMCGLTPARLQSSQMPTRIAESPVNLECKFHSTITLPSNSAKGVHHVVIGEVV